MTMTLQERVSRAAEEIYNRTIRADDNWLDHFHGPSDLAENCAVCSALGLTQEDWDRAADGDTSAPSS